jgi:hypothetical protein
VRRSVPILVVGADGTVTESARSIAELKAESRLHLRELLIVEQLSAYIQPRILPRRHCIVVTVGPARLLVFGDRAYVFSAVTLPGAREFATNLSAAVQAAAGRSSGSSQDRDEAPFEFTVIEQALLASTNKQSKRVAYAKKLVERLLGRMGTVERDDANLYALLPLQNSITHYEIVTRGICDCVRGLLSDDRDMAEACLSEKSRIGAEAERKKAEEDLRGPEEEKMVMHVSLRENQTADWAASGGQAALRGIHPDVLSALELMLEGIHYRAAEANVMTVELGRTIRNKQEILQLQASNYRNWLLSLTLKLGIATTSLASAGTIFSAFGQNLSSGLETVPYGVFASSAVAIAAGAMVFRTFDRMSSNSSPTAAYAQRMQDFSEFLRSIDSRVDAARSTLAAAAATGGPVPAPEQDFGLRLVSARGTSNRWLSSSSQAAAASRAISKNEFKALHMSVTGQSVSDEETQALFDLLDADSDGKLGFDEVLGTLGTKKSS